MTEINTTHESGIEGVPDVDLLEINKTGRIYLHMQTAMTPEQMQLIVDYAKQLRGDKT